MDRITSRTLSGQAIVPIKPKPMDYDAPLTNVYEPAVDRLAAIEDILGDTYDLDHLRELVTADRERRVHIMPCVIKPGDTLYILGYINSFANVEILGPRTVVRTTAERIYYRFNHTASSGSILDVSWSDIGKTVFLTREAAEAALAKMKEG